MSTMTDHNAILTARNSTKKRCNVYYYESMGNIARANGFSASEFAFGCMVMAMQAMRCDLSYLTARDMRIVAAIRSAIEESKKKRV